VMRPVANEGVWGFGAHWERKEGREEEEGGEKAAGGAARRLLYPAQSSSWPVHAPCPVRAPAVS
jgi:hypothetical protein